MAQNSEDLRVRRTRTMLQNALLELTTEKGFSEVTVSDLAERAMINRSTFYRHYLDKYDLLGQYLEALSTRLETEAGDGTEPEKPEDAPDQPPVELVSLLKHMQENAEFYRVILGEKGDPAFCGRSFRPFLEEQIRTILSDDIGAEDGSRVPLGLVVDYVLHAGMGAIVWWLENGRSWMPEQVAAWLLRLSRATIEAALPAEAGDLPVQ